MMTEAKTILRLAKLLEVLYFGVYNLLCRLRKSITIYYNMSIVMFIIILIVVVYLMFHLWILTICICCTVCFVFKAVPLLGKAERNTF